MKICVQSQISQNTVKNNCQKENWNLTAVIKSSIISYHSRWGLVYGTSDVSLYPHLNICSKTVSKVHFNIWSATTGPLIPPFLVIRTGFRFCDGWIRKLVHFSPPCISIKIHFWAYASYIIRRLNNRIDYKLKFYGLAKQIFNP